MKKSAIILTLLMLEVAACGTPGVVDTPSLTASPSMLPSQTPSQTIPPTQPTLTATPILIEGTLITKANVRSGPAASYDSLGQLEAGSKLQILARDSLGAWYLILYSSAPQGRGWVAAQYVTVAAGSEVPLDATPTPAGPTGRVIQRLNVRSGPGTSFDTLGVIEPDVVISLTGKNATASWFQVNYPTGPGGHGWVTSQYVQTDSAAALPVLDDFGNGITPGATGTFTGPVATPSPTIGPAYDDGDSSSNPAIQVSFSYTGTNRFVYSSQVSAPQGDLEDWVGFTTYTLNGTDAHLVVSLACTGNGALVVELWQGGAQFSGWGALDCGDVEKSILLPAGQDYMLRLTLSAGDGLRLVDYTLTVQNDPR